MNTFTIDFFELSFLAEACIPPTPIARAMFWQNLTNIYHSQMTVNERANLFNWMGRNVYFQEQYEKGNNDVVIFYDRFNPENQYLVHYDLGNGKEKGMIECFKNGDEYRTSITTIINKDYITKIEKL